MILNTSELAAVKDCLKRYIEFNNNGVMSTYKVRQKSLLLMDEKEIDIDYKKMIVLKGNKPVYKIIERYSNKTHKMLLPRLEVMERLYNCLRNGIYITCSMYDEFRNLENEKAVDK